MRPLAPAVVIGGDLNGLGVVRSLAAHGIPVHVVDTSRQRPAMWSRHAKPAVVESLSGPRLIDGLVALQKRLGVVPVLFVTEEVAVPTISANRNVLKPMFRFTLPSEAMVDRLSDKALFHHLADEHGLPVPRGAVVSKAEDVSALEGLEYPVVIKPCDKQRVWTGETERINVAATFEEARAICRRLLASAGQLLVQEWADGPESNIYFCLFYRGRNGRIVSLFTGRKMICHPPQLGSTAVCTSAPEWRDRLEPLTRDFAERVDFRGMGSLEFKWDERRNRLIVIEPTVARSDWQEEIATLCGVNIPMAAYCDELGIAPPVDQPRQAFWQASYGQRLPIAARKATTPVYNGYWRLADPVPGICYYAGTLPRLARDRLDAVRRVPAKPPEVMPSFREGSNEIAFD